MRRHSAGRLTVWSGVLMGVALSIATQACEADNPASNALALPADTIQCTSTTDRSQGDALASGLVVQFAIPVDAAGPYLVHGQIYQDRRRGPVSYANSRGVDMSRLSLPDLHSTRVYASEAGVLPVTLWFPGSELRVRARSGEAWLDVQVSDTTWLVRGSETGEQPSPQRFYRCRIARLEPRDFVPNLPGQDRVPPLPKPANKTNSTLMSVGVAAKAEGEVGPARETRTALDPPPVQVFLHKDKKPGAITYGYRVVNGSAFQVSTLLIGFNHYTDSPELRIAPTGWDGDNVPTTNFRAPNGWSFEVTPTEEDSLLNVQWHVDSLTTGLLGGKILAGFEVTVPQADQKYESGHWTVYLKSAQQSFFSGSIDASASTNAPATSVFGRNDVRVKPNPSGAGVIIEYAAPAVGACTIDVLDAAGRSIRRLTASVAQVGRQQVAWDGLDSAGRRAAPADYFVWIRTSTSQRFAQFVLQR